MNCYRHPDREAFVRCQRCERFICPDCQFESAVGFLCPEDAGQNQFANRVVQMAPRKIRNRMRVARAQSASGAPVFTYLTIALCTLVWLAQITVPNDWVTINFAYIPLGTEQEPWRMLTAGYLHDPSSPIHLLLNVYSLYIFGRELEPMLGRFNFAALYLLSVVGGSVAVLWLAQPNSWVVGASGAIFGLMAAYFVVLRTMGANSTQMVGLIAINLAFGFMVQGVSWQGHVGGLITGGVVAFLYSRTRGVSSRANRVRRIGLVAVLLALVALAYAGWVINLAPLF